MTLYRIHVRRHAFEGMRRFYEWLTDDEGAERVAAFCRRLCIRGGIVRVYRGDEDVPMIEMNGNGGDA